MVYYQGISVLCLFYTLLAHFRQGHWKKEWLGSVTLGAMIVSSMCLPCIRPLPGHGCGRCLTWFLPAWLPSSTVRCQAVTFQPSQHQPSLQPPTYFMTIRTDTFIIGLFCTRLFSCPEQLLKSSRQSVCWSVGRSVHWISTQHQMTLMIKKLQIWLKIHKRSFHVTFVSTSARTTTWWKSILT